MFKKRWETLSRFGEDSWRMDSDQVKGVWMYSYRAAYKEGQTMDSYLSRNREANHNSPNARV